MMQLNDDHLQFIRQEEERLASIYEAVAQYHREHQAQ
jgi:hypothetical protein